MHVHTVTIRRDDEIMILSAATRLAAREELTAIERDPSRAGLRQLVAITAPPEEGPVS